MKWLNGQKTSVLSQGAVNVEFLGADYTMLHPKIIQELVHEPFIKGVLNQHIDYLAPAMTEETEFALEQEWGTDTEDWKDIVLFESISRIITRTANRSLVGLPLCKVPWLTKDIVELTHE
jgi:hypothetical protein